MHFTTCYFFCYDGLLYLFLFLRIHVHFFFSSSIFISRRNEFHIPFVLNFFFLHFFPFSQISL